MSEHPKWTLSQPEYIDLECEVNVLNERGTRVVTITYRADSPTMGERASRLISAAPDLYAALTDTYAHFDAHFGTEAWAQSEIANTIRAALSKAQPK